MAGWQRAQLVLTVIVLALLVAVLADEAWARWAG